MKRIFVPKECLMVPGTVIAARFVDMGLIMSNVVRADNYVLHTLTLFSEISIPLANWPLAMYQNNLMISPN